MKQNRYLRLTEPMPAGEPPVTGNVMGVVGGYRGDASPRDIPLEAAADLDAVRFEGNAVRKDFGYRRVGNVALSRVLALIEHKFIESGVTFQRLVRLRRDNASKAVLEVWNGTSWVQVSVSVETILDVYLSTLSIQGKLLVADGSQILIWSEQATAESGGADFPAGNLLDTPAETTLVDAPLSRDGLYTVHFNVKAIGASQGGITVKVAILRNGIEVAEIPFVSAASNDEGFEQSWNNQTFTLSAAAADDIGLQLKSVSGLALGAVTGDPITVQLNESNPYPYSGVGTKAPAPEAATDEYTFNFDAIVGIPEAFATDDYSATFGLYIDIGAGFVLRDTLIVDVPEGQATQQPGQSMVVTLDGVEAGARFAIKVESFTGMDNAAYHAAATDASVTWTPAAGGASDPVTAEVHGLNKLVDLDPEFGLTFSEEGAAISVFEIVDPDAPEARLVYEFADRAVALWDAGDTQSFAWSVSGDIRDWTGEGSGQIFLVSASTDPIDDLTGFASLSSNVGALFRKRSIMRVVPTGNPLQALGVVKWVDAVGTESSFSIQNVERGVMFLGHNRMVYFMDESGAVAVGGPIHKDLIATVTGDPQLVDSAYDSAFNEYILGVAEGNSPNITKLWIFDVGAFVNQKVVRWRARSVAVQRLASVSRA